jgi:hypothetical protein
LFGVVVALAAVVVAVRQDRQFKAQRLRLVILLFVRRAQTKGRKREARHPAHLQESRRQLSVLFIAQQEILRVI